jgi:hypothetical protein
MSRRGFVMPIVMLLALIIGLLSSVVLARAAQRSTIVRDQLAAYTASHRDRGVKELAAAWLMYSYTQDLEAMTGGGPDGGDAFTVTIGRTTTVNVRIEPAQRTARINPIGLNADDGRLARETETILRERFGEIGLRGRTREVGPVALDAFGATDDVLAAVAQATLEGIDPIDDDTADRFVRQLRREDNGTRINPAMVLRAVDNLGLQADARDRLAAVLGTTPTLWRVTAEWNERDPARPALARREVYTGLINLTSQTRSNFGAQHPKELFLEWDMIDGADDPTGYTDPAGGRGRPGA